MGRPGQENSFATSHAPSERSQKSRYRTVNKASHVDTTLFSSKTAKKLEAARAPPPNEHHVTKKLGKTGARSEEIPAVVLSRKDLERMMQPAGAQTAEQILQHRLAVQAAAEQETLRTNERRNQMLALEAERKKAEPPSEMEQLRIKERQAIHSAARKALLEQEDEVKAMNRMVIYSRCAAEREQQLAERQLRLASARGRERTLDAQMEADRRQAVEMYEERDRQRAVEQRKGAAVLAEQLEERERERLRHEDLRYQEGKRMQQLATEAKEAENRALEKRKVASRDLMASVVESNAALAATKRAAQGAEAEQERRIMEYQRQRELHEQEAAEAKAALARAKDLEVARLWATQQKLVDRNIELDELRARRAQDAYERDMRKREADSIARAHAIQRDLDEARANQAADRMAARAIQAAFENAEHARVIQETQEIIRQAADLEDKQAASRKAHAEQLRAQIVAREEAAKVVRAAKIAEGAQLRARLAEHKALVEAAKQEKLQALVQEGIPEKYRAGLARFKPSG